MRVDKGDVNMKDCQDAFGHAFYEYYSGSRHNMIVERADGYIDVGSIAAYFTKFRDWPAHVKKAMKYVHGKVVDVGCGAGRHSIYLQKKGYDVLGTDVSPLAAKVCKLRGLKKIKVLPATRINKRLGMFGTILMLGNNFGLFANRKRLRWLLKRFSRMTSGNARIIAESRNPYETDESWHLRYHKLNRERGRMSGQVRIRVRYKKYAEPWYDYLMVSPNEMDILLKDTAWKIKRFIGKRKALYIAIIEKKHTTRY